MGELISRVYFQTLKRSHLLRFFSDTELKKPIPQILKLHSSHQKKLVVAVKRNRIKRLMREAYRLNQQLVDNLSETPLLIHVALIARSSDFDFKVIQNDVVTLLHKLRTRVAEHPLLNT